MNKCRYCNKDCAKKYCSNKCQANLTKQKIRKNIELHGFSESDSYSRIKQIRRFLRDTKGVKCEICKSTSWNEKEIPLVVDHIDGKSTNNNLENLRLICCNCDAQLPTYKGRNKGKGTRNYRKKYYERHKEIFSTARHYFRAVQQF